MIRELPIPDRTFDGVRRTPVHLTLKDVFCAKDFQARAFRDGDRERDDGDSGLRRRARGPAHRGAAARSAREGCRVTIAEIIAAEA